MNDEMIHLSVSFDRYCTAEVAQMHIALKKKKKKVKHSTVQIQHYESCSLHCAIMNA